MEYRLQHESEIETLITDRVSGKLDLKLIKHLRRNPNEEWDEVLNDLVKFLASHASEAKYLDKGRRYAAYEVCGIIVKFLITRKASRIIDPISNRKIDKSGSQCNIFHIHQNEHEVVNKFLNEFILDTIFLSREEEEGFHDLPQVDAFPSFKTEKPFMMIQECVFGNVSLLEALKTYRVELKTFRNGVESLYNALTRMRDEKGLIPEIAQAHGENLSVSRSGKLWVVDTNNLLHSASKRHESLVARYFGLLENVLTGLEKGHIKGNPNG